MITPTAPVTITFAAIDLTGTLEHDDDQRQLTLWTDEGAEDISVGLASYGHVAPSGHVYIKDWSEHHGLASTMETQGLVRIVETVHVGPFSTQAHLVEVLT